MIPLFEPFHLCIVYNAIFVIYCVNLCINQFPIVNIKFILLNLFKVSEEILQIIKAEAGLRHSKECCGIQGWDKN